MRVLVLAIDRDDDFGKKAGVKGPVIGKGKCIDAALKLSLADPEDSDANVVYAAVKLYDELKSAGKFDEVEVALITGHPKVGVESDMELARQLDEVLKKFPADGLIPVTDGAEDEQVFPILASRVRILSSRRVVIKQNENIETTYYIIYRYIKEILNDPEAAKVFLGIPGFILLLYGIGKLISIGYPQGMNIVSGIVTGTLLLLLGGYAFTKGFKFRVRETLGNQFIEVVSVVAGVLVMIAGMINAYRTLPSALQNINSGPATSVLKFIMYINQVNAAVVFGIGVIMVGRIVQAYLKKDYHIWYHFAAIGILPALWITVDITTKYAMSMFELFSVSGMLEVMVAILDIILSVLVATRLRRRFRVMWGEAAGSADGEGVEDSGAEVSA
ncbi:MAG: DUF373 family protein [Thermococci archaeon]|nr:DUF373 family protein [Thermococci archaeon]